MAVTVTPTIHLNGTSAAELTRQVETAYTAINAAADALAQAAPNARDYYPQGAGAYSRAADEHTARLVALQSIAADLETIATAIFDATAARERR